VLPTVLMLEWMAHAAIVQNPGLLFHGCDDLRVLQGVTLDGPQTPTIRVGAGKATRKEGLFIAPAELRSTRPDGVEVLHARADVILASALPPAPKMHPAPVMSDDRMYADFYGQHLLFHGPALQGIKQIEGCGEAGIIGLVQAAPPVAAWVRRPLRRHWLTDPLVLDGSFQLMILWTQYQRGAASLPCHVRRYRQYRQSYPSEATRVLVTIKRASEMHALADIDLVEPHADLVARLEGYECVIDPALQRAFRRSSLVLA
jgi:hypothetical protein